MNVPLRVVKTPAEAMLSEQYAAARGKLGGGARIIELRDHAFRTIETQGLPNRRIEEWKYTDLRALMREAKPLAVPSSGAAAPRPSPFKTCGLREIVFFDGAFVPALSDLANLESGLSITPLSQALKSDHAVLRDRLGRLAPAQPNAALALNTAFMSDGAVIHVAKGSRIERPVHLRFVRGGEANASFDRIVLVVEEGAAVTLVKSFEGPDGVEYQTNTALEAFVGDRAQVRIDRLQDEGRAALHLSTLMVELGKNAELSTMALTKGAAIARHQIYVTFRGEHAQAAIRGANLLNGDQHADTTMVVDHAAVHGASRETFKSVLEGRSRGVFQGKIIVQPHAQKTDGKMASHALLLSENAEMNNKPELEIFADDVQCGHGATVGSLNKDLLFYLKARGIPEKEAQALLIQSFVGEAIEGVEHEGVRDAMTEIVAKWLAART